MGIQTAMLTGDSEAAANAVASSTGIDRVYAKLLPGDKLDLLQHLRKTSSMEAIPESLRIAKKTGAIAAQNVVFALAVKVLVMVLGLAGFASMWMAVFADSGVAMLCVLKSIRLIYKKN